MTHVLTFCWAVILVFSYHDCRDRRPRKGVLVVHGFKGPVTNYITTYCDESVKITQHT